MASTEENQRYSYLCHTSIIEILSIGAQYDIDMESLYEQLGEAEMEGLDKKEIKKKISLLKKERIQVESICEDIKRLAEKKRLWPWKNLPLNEISVP